MTPPLQDPPLVIDQEVRDALMKDPLYGPRMQTAIEIGSIIVKGEKNAA